jgi:AcrR family transcriptional regulator
MGSGRSARQETNQRGVAQRERVLTAARDLFTDRGYRGTGIITKAKRVGIDHATVLYHFGTKKNLLRAVMERSDRLHAAAMTDLSEFGLDEFLEWYATGRSLMEPEELRRLVAVLRVENLNPADPLHDMLELRMSATESSLPPKSECIRNVASIERTLTLM